MPIQIKIPNHMIMPFGCNKWEIDDIHISGVSTDGTYITSKTKCVHIDLASKEPLRLAQFLQFFPDEESNFPHLENSQEALSFARNFLKENCGLATRFERKFLDIYFDHVLTSVRWNYPGMNPRLSSHDREMKQNDFNDFLRRVFLAPMPFPQAHIYARDPMVKRLEEDFTPSRMFMVDFAFWTGSRLVAVEIDGGSHIGSAQHVTKDRMLARSGVHVIHILNDELELDAKLQQYGSDIIERLLPKEIAEFDPSQDIPAHLDKSTLNPFFSDNIPY